MGNLTDAERPLPPRPAYHSMPNAVRAAILSGNTLADINLCRWGETYRCEPSDIQQVWEVELTRRSQEPNNSFEEYDK